MNTALIMMTILGCDDSVSQCHFIAKPEQHYVSVELCDAASEKVLERYSNVNYPMVVAVCQPPDAKDGLQAAAAPKQADKEPELAAPATALPEAPIPEAPIPEETKRNFAARAVSRIREALPGTSDIRMVFETPVHVIADSYSWVAKKLTQ
ncbi:hypothetical protein HGO38_15290 [Rhizobium sp. CG5]|uniref:hypothetical protein n=1 Tax=Rhizobium sp. CG5 TaxID=2726076 RepID=UPI00203428BF|nr:hypothetical protein [Rhizobium sp. CG5]MCM2474844.1 hypothetical protein [Rhizobium sp. CG5]